MGIEDTNIKAAIKSSKEPGAVRATLKLGNDLMLIIVPPNRKELGGAAIWVQRYRSPEDGKRRDYELGRYPAVTLAAVRKSAEAIRTGISSGIAPYCRQNASLQQGWRKMQPTKQRPKQGRPLLRLAAIASRPKPPGWLPA